MWSPTLDTTILTRNSKIQLIHKLRFLDCYTPRNVFFFCSINALTNWFVDNILMSFTSLVYYYYLFTWAVRSWCQYVNFHPRALNSSCKRKVFFITKLVYRINYYFSLHILIFVGYSPVKNGKIIFKSCSNFSVGKTYSWN